MKTATLTGRDLALYTAGVASGRIDAWKQASVAMKEALARLDTLDPDQVEVKKKKAIKILKGWIRDTLSSVSTNLEAQIEKARAELDTNLDKVGTGALPKG